MIVPPLSQLGQLEDAELGKLSVDWRLQAARGLQHAFGIAHVLEVEVRRRQRAMRANRQHHALETRAGAPRAAVRQRWWGGWRSTGPSASDPTAPA